MENKLKTMILKLYLTRGIGNLGIQRLVAQDVDLAALSAEEISIQAGVVKKAEFITSWKETNTRFLDEKIAEFTANNDYITIVDEEYPEALRETYAPPSVLFYRGEIALLQQPLLAVVGSRHPRAESVDLLRMFLPDLFIHELVIASGLASGIDGLAHEMCLENEVPTIAVMGTGLDQCYPKQHESLKRRIEEKGLVLSEYLPAVGPKRHHFPLRNRIIAGIARGTLIVEAKKRSGSLITAQIALENGREVFVFPGSPLYEAYLGSLQLIQDGAKCVFKPQHIIEEINAY